MPWRSLLPGDRCPEGWIQAPAFQRLKEAGDRSKAHSASCPEVTQDPWARQARTVAAIVAELIEEKTTEHFNLQ